MSDIDLNPLQTYLAGRFDRGNGHLNGSQRSQLLPVLLKTQEIYGYLPQEAAAEIGRALGVPLAEVNGVIEFYTLLHNQPTGKTLIQVCEDPACTMAGGEAVLEALRRHLGIQEGEDSPDGKFSLERVPCLGLCDCAPALLVGDKPLGKANLEAAASLCRGEGQPVHTYVGGDLRLLTGGCQPGRRRNLEAYLAGGGYGALTRAFSSTPQALIAEVKASGLVGRGGAAFPTGVKWEGAAAAPGEKRFVVCNADESEPGTFKDRVLMEGDPHLILEGMSLAAYAIGAQKGYIYVRGEYARAYASLEAALVEARQAGYLGKRIQGSDFSFEIELRRGAGAYICGEETALFESIEGKRGYPRLKPPFPTTHGLLGLPTAINNVETLCNVPIIIQNGAAWYRRLGTEKSSGPKLFCVSGDVARPGLYEVPFGVTLRHLVNDLAGGLPSGQDFGMALLGGAAGAFATRQDLDVQLSFEHLKAAGLPLGSGVVMVFNAQRSRRDVLLSIGRFFADESCGKCYPCQIGTQRQYEILQRVVQGGALPGDAGRLSDVGWTMSDASICGLGQTAASAVLSALKLWPELFEPFAKSAQDIPQGEEVSHA